MINFLVLIFIFSLRFFIQSFHIIHSLLISLNYKVLIWIFKFFKEFSNLWFNSSYFLKKLSWSFSSSLIIYFFSSQDFNLIRKSIKKTYKIFFIFNKITSFLLKFEIFYYNFLIFILLTLQFLYTVI